MPFRRKNCTIDYDLRLYQSVNNINCIYFLIFEIFETSYIYMYCQFIVHKNNIFIDVVQIQIIYWYIFIFSFFSISLSIYNKKKNNFPFIRFIRYISFVRLFLKFPIKDSIVFFCSRIKGAVRMLLRVPITIAFSALCMIRFNDMFHCICICLYIYVYIYTYIKKKWNGLARIISSRDGTKYLIDMYFSPPVL